MQKSLHFLLLIGFVALVFACKKSDDGTDTTNPTTEPSDKFVGVYTGSFIQQGTGGNNLGGDTDKLELTKLTDKQLTGKVTAGSLVSNSFTVSVASDSSLVFSDQTVFPGTVYNGVAGLANGDKNLKMDFLGVTNTADYANFTGSK